MMVTEDELDKQIIENETKLEEAYKILQNYYTDFFIKRIEIISLSMENIWCLMPDDFPKKPKDDLLGAITLLRVAIRTLKGLST